MLSLHHHKLLQLFTLPARLSNLYSFLMINVLILNQIKTNDMKKTNDSTQFKLALLAFILFLAYVDARLWLTEFIPFAKIAGTFFLVIIAFIAVLKIDQLNQWK